MKDAEAIRKLMHGAEGSQGDKEAPRWSILGQSFGGFCAVQSKPGHNSNEEGCCNMICIEGPNLCMLRVPRSLPLWV